MASLIGNPDSLVVLHFHDFRAEWIRHWWNLLKEEDHASIRDIFGKFSSLMRLWVDRGLLEVLASFWDPTHYCFSIGEMDLVPTLEEYAELFQLGSPFSETPVIPTQGPRSNRVLEKYLGLTSAVGDFPAELAGDFIAGELDWKKSRVNAFKIAFVVIVLLSETGRRGPDVLHVASPAMVLQSLTTVDTVLLFTGNSHDWVLYLLDLPLSEWSWRVTWGPAVWRPWTHCTLFDGVPLLGIWGCTGYYPSLALRQFGSIQYPPRLGDLSSVTFDYVPGDDMWRFLTRVEDIWRGRCSEMVLVEDGLLANSSVTADFVEWREGWSPSFSFRPTVWSGVSHPSVPPFFRVSAPTGQSERVADLERELEEARAELASLRLTKASDREESIAHVESMRSTLHQSNALKISEGATDHLEQTLAETREQLETKQVERTRVQDELDSLRSYTQALVNPSTGRPHDIVTLQRALDESEASLTAARTSIEAMRV
uniref:DUF7745 domain-containing protein n=1 Tax=Fagus sylvatica TaxID=28930 RepID=A0A2N9HC70_FAGSY